MKILTITLLASLLVSAQQDRKVVHDLDWTNIRPQYKAFADINPILVNRELKSIYLSRIYPNGYAQLQRFDETSGKWELGEWSISCGTVAEATVPIEIKSGESRAIEVYWKVSMDDWDNPRFFVLRDHETKRPPNGRYKLILRYALEPWTVIHHPKRTYIVESEEFRIE